MKEKLLGKRKGTKEEIEKAVLDIAKISNPEGFGKGREDVIDSLAVAITTGYILSDLKNRGLLL